MADDYSDEEPRPLPGPDPAPTYYSPGQWEVSIEARLKRVTMVAYADGAIAIGAIALGFLAFKGLTNLAKGLGQLGELTTATHQAVFGNPAVPTVPTRPPKGFDETVRASKDMGDVAEPFDRGPVDVPDDIVTSIESDPLPPRDIKGPEL